MHAECKTSSTLFPTSSSHGTLCSD
jgi:hypothetical protein